MNAMTVDGVTNMKKSIWVVLGLAALLLWPYTGVGQSTAMSIDNSTLIIPTSANDHLGAPNSMAVADFNDDGFQDILIAAPNADQPNGSNTSDNGIAYIIYGKNPFPNKIDLKSFTNADVVIVGKDFVDHLGTAVAAGDVNGDGISDIILGAPDADGPLNQDSETGEVYVVFGSTSLPTEIDLSQTQPPVTLDGDTSNAGFGSTLTTVDLNADGIKDIVVGQPQGNGPGGSRPGGGVVFVYFGAPNLISPIPNIGFKRPDIVIYGVQTGDNLGAALTQGDFNADGRSDLAIGAPLAAGPGRSNAGAVYVLAGAANLPAIVDLASASTTGTGSLQVIGADANDHLGTAIDSGDANQDGIDDLLIGAPMAAGPDNLRGFSGEAYLVLGRENLPPVIDIADNSDIAIKIFGANALDGLGNAVLIENIDEDAAAELVLAASNAKGSDSEGAGAGMVYVIKGRPSFPPQFDLANDEANTVIRGGKTGDALGSALAVGALEGTKKGNLLVGAVGADGPGGRTDSGLIYVFLTVATEPPTSPTADAGPDWCVVPGTTLSLDGSGSKDPDGKPLTYRWTLMSQPEGSAAVLDDPTVVAPSFTADVVGEYVFELTVTATTGASATDQVSVFSLTKGDVNFDGVVDGVDAQLVADYIVGNVELTLQQQFAADVIVACQPDPNAIDVNDVRWIAELRFKPDQLVQCTDPVAKPRS